MSSCEIYETLRKSLCFCCNFYSNLIKNDNFVLTASVVQPQTKFERSQPIGIGLKWTAGDGRSNDLDRN